MAIKEITAEKLGEQKAGWTYDRKRELWATFQVDTTFNGARHIRRGFRTEKDAEKYLQQLDVQERLKEIGAVQIIKFPKAAALFDIYAVSLVTKSERVLAKRVFEQFLALLPPGATVDEIKRKHTREYVERRIAGGVKTETADRELNCISGALKKSGDFFAELENWQSPVIYRPPVTDDTRQRVVSRDERDRLIDYLLRQREETESDSEHLGRRRAGLTFYFALLTGLRHGEICALERINFDRKNRRLLAERLKTKRSGVRWTIFEPLTTSQLSVLTEAETLYPDGAYFFSSGGRRHNKTYDILKSACEHLKIPYGKKTANGLILHDARHTFVTVLEHGAIDSSTTRSFSGHSKDAMLKRYAHATPDSRSRAMDVIEKEIGGGGLQKEAEIEKIYNEIATGKLTLENFKKWMNDFLTVF